MNELALLAERTRNVLLNSSFSPSFKSNQISTMMNENFNLRKELFGKEAIGNNNLRMIELANKYGFAAKFTGSGGAIVGLWNGDVNKNDESEIDKNNESEIDKNNESEIDKNNESEIDKSNESERNER